MSTTLRRFLALVRTHLFDANAAHNALLIGSQLVFCGLLALIGAVLTRHYIVPNQSGTSFPLHFTFSTCTDSLHGVCSFPTARVDLDQLDAGQTYAFALTVQLYDRSENDRLGQFQLSAKIYAAEDEKPLRTLRRTVSVSGPPGWIWTLSTLWLKPVWWILGAGSSARFRLDVPLNGDYTEGGHSVKDSAQFVDVSLEHREAYIESGELRISARLGLIRYFAVHWPITSFFVTGSFIFLTLGSIVAACWTVKALIALPNFMAEQEALAERQREEELAEVQRNFEREVLEIRDLPRPGIPAQDGEESVPSSAASTISSFEELNANDSQLPECADAKDFNLPPLLEKSNGDEEEGNRAPTQEIFTSLGKGNESEDSLRLRRKASGAAADLVITENL